ncbi:MAG: hypothetical protein AMXMBFR13_09010 [Phycisphaerae bacterium]
MNRWTLFAAAFAAVLATGCERSDQTQSNSPGTHEPAAALPPGLILAESPPQAKNVVEAKKEAQIGEEVVVRGRIGGRGEPFVENRAIFQLVDSSLPTCADNPGDGCKTPWDYCCEPKDQITAKSMTVQIVGADGKPLRTNLKGQGGLVPMAKVVIRGKVEQKPDENTMTVRADGIYVEQS